MTRPDEQPEVDDTATIDDGTDATVTLPTDEPTTTMPAEEPTVTMPTEEPTATVPAEDLTDRQPPANEKPTVPQPLGGQPAPTTPRSYTDTPNTVPGVTPPATRVSFGLLTWSLVLITIGVMILLAPYMPLLDPMMTTAAAFGGLGVVMLVIATVVYLREHSRSHEVDSH